MMPGLNVIKVAIDWPLLFNKWENVTFINCFIHGCNNPALPIPQKFGIKVCMYAFHIGRCFH